MKLRSDVKSIYTDNFIGLNYHVCICGVFVVARVDSDDFPQPNTSMFLVGRNKISNIHTSTRAEIYLINKYYILSRIDYTVKSLNSTAIQFPLCFRKIMFEILSFFIMIEFLLILTFSEQTHQKQTKFPWEVSKNILIVSGKFSILRTICPLTFQMSYFNSIWFFCVNWIARLKYLPV